MIIILGVTNDVVHGIETMHPTNAEEFNIFRKALVDVVTKYDVSSVYELENFRGHTFTSSCPKNPCYSHNLNTSLILNVTPLKMKILLFYSPIFNS